MAAIEQEQERDEQDRVAKKTNMTVRDLYMFQEVFSAALEQAQ